MSDIAIAVSVSGGKDSTACLLLALERFPKDQIFPIFADVGNEHPVTYEYINYLSKRLDIEIETVKADFSEWWWRRRDYVRDKWKEPHKNWPDGVPQDRIDRVLKVFEGGPTGVPFLDLCIIKGRFPSRRAQFCTDFLKKQPLNARINELCIEHKLVESWQGVRKEESSARAKLTDRVEGEELFVVYRPILEWKSDEVFDFHDKHDVEPNPLYRENMKRVGCMPCINCSKGELHEIATRYPEHIDRIREWERVVAEGSKIGDTTFFPSPGGDDDRLYIDDRVEWAKTAHGGVQLDLLKTAEPTHCSSHYGLCE